MNRSTLLAAVLAAGGKAAAPLLPFTDEFTRADGDLGNGWEYTAEKWTVATNAAAGAPGMGDNLFVNGGFDADANWTKEADWTIGSGTGNKAAGAATRQISQNVATAHKWHRYDWTVTALTASWFNVKNTANTFARAATGTFIDIGRNVTVLAGFEGVAATAGSIDNVSCKQLTLVDQFCTRDLGSADVDISVPITMTDHTQAGIVICLDSAATPANYILAYYNGTRAILDKCVGGTYTQLISTLATYGAGRVLRVRKSGTTVQLFYNGAQIGTDQTVSDAGVISNTRHGLFTTYASNTFGSFTAANPT